MTTAALSHPRGIWHNWFTYVAGNWLTWGSYGAAFTTATAFLLNPMLSLIGVGLAYGTIAHLFNAKVLLPLLKKRGIDADGDYTKEGLFWSNVAGFCVATGAGTLAFALKFCPGGHGVVMPIVFCGTAAGSTLSLSYRQTADLLFSFCTGWLILIPN